jgi:hypothetical protein
MVVCLHFGLEIYTMIKGRGSNLQAVAGHSGGAMVGEWVNPYTAGAPVTEARMFFGREAVFDWIQSSLVENYTDHILVIHGQRRAGQISVLKRERGMEIPASDKGAFSVDLEYFETHFWSSLHIDSPLGTEHVPERKGQCPS